MTAAASTRPALDCTVQTKRQHDMDKTLPNTRISTDATLFREEAERARLYAAAMTDKKVIDRLNEIAARTGFERCGHRCGGP